MQYVRHVDRLLGDQPAARWSPRPRTPTPRKIARDASTRSQIEKELTKDQILERYLNIAPFGNGAYGIFAASQVYFSKEPKDLTLDEAALLAGMVKAPVGVRPHHARPATRRRVDRRDYVLGQMVEIGAITAGAGRPRPRPAKLAVKGKRTPNGCVGHRSNDWGFFCDYFYRWWLEQEAFGATTYDRERRLKSGGYRIVTSLDVKAQDGGARRTSSSSSRPATRTR